MDARHSLDVSIVTPEGVLFEGKAQRVIFPGENGVFEVLINHKPVLGRLVSGEVVVDEMVIPIESGVARVALNQVLAVVEPGS